MTASPPASPSFLDAPGGVRLAYLARPGASPTVVFLGGYASDMTGTKASYLDDWCGARGHAFVRFDYRGHGRSSGQLVDGTIGAWRDDALAGLRQAFSHNANLGAIVHTTDVPEWQRFRAIQEQRGFRAFLEARDGPHRALEARDAE